MKNGKMIEMGHRVYFFDDGKIQVKRTRRKVKANGKKEFAITQDRQEHFFANYKAYAKAIIATHGKLFVTLLAAALLCSCADTAFQQYIQNRQAAISAMPDGPAKFYEQARLDEQILADKREQQQRAAAAAAIFAAGMANAGAIYAQGAQTPVVYPIIQHNTLGTALNPLVIRSAGY